MEDETKETVAEPDEGKQVVDEESAGEWADDSYDEQLAEEDEDEYEDESDENYEGGHIIGEIKEKSSLDEIWGDEEEEEGEGEGEEEEQKPEAVQEEFEEEGLPEEPPPDPTAPYNLTDSSEALKAPFKLSPEQLAECEEVWALYQDYTPAYNDLDNYITEVELVYMLKCLNLITYTPEQMQELIAYCVRPPHEQGHINYQQFVSIVTIRQRDIPAEEELRLALEVMDPDKTGQIDREYLKEVLATTGYKMSQKVLENFIKEVDMTNDGLLGIEDIIGTVCIDLNRDDIIMLLNQLNPPETVVDKTDELL